MLEIKSVSKNFGGVQALKDISFQVEEGEIHAVVGENGAGKSTLMNILSGVYTDYLGELLWNGQPLRFKNPRDAQIHGVAIIHQELNLITELTITENIFLGRESYTPLGILDNKKMENEAIKLLERLNLYINPNRKVKGLRMGEQQLVEVAKALSLDAKLLILDEPTSALSENEIEKLFAVIKSLKQEGTTMIYISHKLDEIFQISDRITVFRDGQYIGTKLTKSVNQKELIQMMVNREFEELFPNTTAQAGNTVLEVKNLFLSDDPRKGRHPLYNISFDLKRGEIIGVAGLLGAGRTELLETLFGVNNPKRVKGQILINGLECHFHSPSDAIDAGLAFVTEDRKTQSLILKMSVAHNITISALKKFLTHQIIRKKDENNAVQLSIKELQIKTSSPNVLVSKLSGGNQQKVSLAKCLLTNPHILLLDEPTHGIDVGAKAEIYALLSRLVNAGASIIMASSELPEILAMCDRILVLCEGRLTAVLHRSEATQEKIMEAATEFQTSVTETLIPQS
ncbi:sugar ABC transporter ATP-binding protein [Flexilinea flocculi]|uniref:ABC-type sugar transport system, ATPase component n=1 Tax=Flexilinea flocculi TaxID=1678840 RepID=A0A0S7BU97_9CHLR|nr:sugar ABC transporter ATP-binding protein [Flexilinea flocculi]GAP41422.1 ABC-type sugar transport system, ATPase component [Flexilinea flocculi]